MFVTLGPKNDTGFRKHLEELILSLNYPSKFIPISEKNCKNTLKEIKFLRPKLTIIGGRNWILRNYKILKMIPGKKAILYCSPLAQAEISSEELNNLSIYLQWLDQKLIDYIFVGSEALVRILKRKDVLYLPAPSYSDLKIKPRINIPKRNIVAVFNDKAVHKNILNTIAGVSLSKNTEEFWINGAKKEYISLMKRFGIKNLKNIGYIPRKNFYKTLRQVKLILQLSFSEGFSYSAFEAMNLGIPVLSSQTVYWNRIPLLKVKNYEDHKEIGKKIDKILSLNKKEYTRLSKECIKSARKSIKKNNHICKSNLKKIFPA